MRKSVWAALLAALTGFGIAGCGDTTTERTSNSSVVPAGQPTTTVTTDQPVNTVTKETTTNTRVTPGTETKKEVEKP